MTALSVSPSCNPKSDVGDPKDTVMEDKEEVSGHIEHDTELRYITAIH